MIMVGSMPTWGGCQMPIQLGGWDAMFEGLDL